MNYPQSLINLGDPSQTYVGGGNGSGGSFMSSLMNPSMNGNPMTSPLGLMGQLISGSAQTDATNRYLGNQQNDQFNNAGIAAQANERANNAAGLKQLAQTGYILNGGSKFNPGSITLNGKVYPINTMGMGPMPSTDAQKAGAGDLQNTLLANLRNGGTLRNGSYVPVAPQTKPSTGEKVKNGLGGALSGAAAGSVLGPAGIIGGGLIGGLMSLF